MAKEISEKDFEWFPFYVDVFIMDTAQWKDEEVGVYIRLLCSQWRNGYLINNLDRLQHLTSVKDPKHFDEIWAFVGKKFILNEKGFINQKLETVRSEQFGKATKTKNRAVTAADKRWGNVELPFTSEAFKEAWDRRKEYLKTEYRFTFKSDKSQRAQLDELVSLSGNNEELAIKIIDQSPKKGWRGLFPLKEDFKQKTNTHELGQQDHKKKL